MSQLTLHLHLRNETTFENFYVCDKNKSLLQCLKSERLIYLWGDKGVGRTHLLQACCHEAILQECSAMYLPLSNIKQWSSSIFEGLENLSLICLDDIDAVVGYRNWEEAIFHFYNRVIEKEQRLIISSSEIPQRLNFVLADLCSRLTASIIFHVKGLSDEEKLEVLKIRANTKGLLMPEEVGKYLLSHHSRDMASLCDALEQLDQASLVSQRRLTIPFVKSVLHNPLHSSGGESHTTY